ncbi:MAG: prepilin-type N-terminal cleavage/methylation domain-containing protein [Myxococcales bacterium]|nr:prepilin-type N-terminal cleavage/methylation domain-containing protein [Myxococcales bacterium]
MKTRKGIAKGFTLIELIVVLATLSVLLAIGIPGFMGYVARSKTSEALTNLNLMFKGSAAYYLQASAGSQGVGSGTAGHCIVGTTSLLPAVPTAAKQQANFLAVAEYKSLGFSISDPVYYGYRLVANGGTSACDMGASTTLYTFMAMGDLDGDSVFSRFELATGSDASNVLYHSVGMYIVNESE